MITLKNIAVLVGVLLLHVAILGFNDFYVSYGIESFNIVSGILGGAIGSLRFGLSKESTQLNSTQLNSTQIQFKQV